MADKFHRTVIEVEVLSRGEPPEFEGLYDVAYAIDEGDCSGKWRVVKQEKVEPGRMVELLEAQGSGPEFLGLDEDGNDLEEDQSDEGH